MKTFTTIRFRPIPQHFDHIVETLTKRVDFWARHSATEKVYLIQDDDEVVFTAILSITIARVLMRKFRPYLGL